MFNYKLRVDLQCLSCGNEDVKNEGGILLCQCGWAGSIEQFMEEEILQDPYQDLEPNGNDS